MSHDGHDALLKHQIQQRLWETVDTLDFVTSATLTGSFVESVTLDGISDIDFVLVVDRLNEDRFDLLQREFDRALRDVLRTHGYDLHINATLGPLKWNRPDLAVLHLMIYSEQAHVDHVLHSPFTCLDWQRSPVVRKRSLAEVFPVFGLQPRHFFGARRGAKDYLRDFNASVVSYRELICDRHGYTERKREKPMTLRDRHEFAYHVCRFLMANLNKLIAHSNEGLPNEPLAERYFGYFPTGAESFAPFFRELTRKKKQADFREPLPELDAQLTAFVSAFEEQFHTAFVENATRHLAFRHAPTGLNQASGSRRHFQGRIDVDALPIAPEALGELRSAVDSDTPARVFASPLKRCRQSLAALGFHQPIIDERLIEIDYGDVDGMSVEQAQARHPELFAAWARGEEPRFPGGENTPDVAARVAGFVADHWKTGEPSSLVGTHNVVLRCLIGETLGVPPEEWYRMRVPHLKPITFIRTERFGLFVDLSEGMERELFAAFTPAQTA